MKGGEEEERRERRSERADAMERERERERAQKKEEQLEIRVTIRERGESSIIGRQMNARGRSLQETKQRERSGSTSPRPTSSVFACPESLNTYEMILRGSSRSYRRTQGHGKETAPKQSEGMLLCFHALLLLLRALIQHSGAG